MYGGTKKSFCVHCNKHISNNNIKKHEPSCSLKKNNKKKIRGVDYDPNWGYAAGIRQSWNKGKTKDTDLRIASASEKLKETIKTHDTTHGFCKDPIKEVERRKKLSDAAKRNNFGGYRENAGRSKKFKVRDSLGKETTLQSSYEYKCFQILNELDIKWVRPKSLKYDNKNYFADFYLIDHEIYLDPKNDYKAKQDLDKIKKVIEQNDVKLFVLLQHQITKEYIGRLTEMD